mmetsp:Transcript_33170/g.51445  ORF Transcript_33170/g.51445 Transcript_33170/m.51445 type:complete len:486 (-) Transcript_33170:1253-2710(-)
MLLDGPTPEVLDGFRRRTRGEDCTDGLLAMHLLRGAHLKAAEPVDAEPRAVLGTLVEDGCGLLQSLLEHLRLSPEVDGREAATPLAHSRLARDLNGGPPGGREQGAGSRHLECVAVEVLHPLLLHGFLLPHKGPQALNVRAAGVRWDKTVPLLAPIGQAWVEDALEQALVLLGEHSVINTLNVRPEGAADVDAFSQLPGNILALGLCRCGQVELVQVEVHARNAGWLHTHGPKGPLELPRRKPRAQRGAEVPGGLHELPGSQTGAHHPGWLPRAGECELVQADAGGNTSRLHAHRPEGALELPRRQASAERRAEVPGGLNELPGGQARAHHPGRLPRTRELELVKAKLHASVHALQAGTEARIRIHNLAILHTDLGAATVVPKLGHLKAASIIHLLHGAEPVVIKARVNLVQEFRHHRSLGQLTQVEDHAFALRDQVKVVREGLCILDGGVVRPGSWDIIQAALAQNLLASLDAHFDIRHQHLVV